MLDADLALDTSEINSIISNMRLYDATSYDAVFTSRVVPSFRMIHKKIYRHIFGRLITTLFGLFWRLIPYDTRCRFKFFRVSNLNKLENFRVRTKWFFEIELIIELKRPLGPKLKFGKFLLTIRKTLENQKLDS